MSPVWVSPSPSPISAFASPKSATQTTPAGVEQEVRRFDVAVANPLRVGVGERVRRLGADPRDGSKVRGAGLRDQARTLRCQRSHRVLGRDFPRPRFRIDHRGRAGCRPIRFALGRDGELAAEQPLSDRSGDGLAVNPGCGKHKWHGVASRLTAVLHSVRSRRRIVASRRTAMPQPPQLVENRVDTLPADELHRVIRHAILFTHGEDWHDVGVVQTGRRRGPRGGNGRAGSGRAGRVVAGP